MEFGLAPKNDSTPVDPGITEGPGVYVGAASSELERAKRVMKLLRDKGIRVTSTWVETITNVGDANPMSAPLIDQQKWSQQDLNEVMDAQVLLLLLPPKGIETIGAYVEYGFALALQMLSEQMIATGAPVPPRVIVTAGRKRSIFFSMAEHSDTDEEAVEKLAEAMGR
jgi:hypothetical protein